MTPQNSQGVLSDQTLLSAVRRELVNVLAQVHKYELRTKHLEKLVWYLLLGMQILCTLAMISTPDPILSFVWYFASLLVFAAQLIAIHRQSA